MIPLPRARVDKDMPNTNSFNAFEDLDAKGSPLSASARDGIWLLDDDASMLRALGRLLNSAGFIVEKFNHPAAFLSRLEQARCQVAVLDVWMPVMSGLEVQACLRRESAESQEKSQQICQFQCCSMLFANAPRSLARAGNGSRPDRKLAAELSKA